MFSKTTQYSIQFVLLIIPFLLPQFHLHNDNSTLLTAVSLLFAILVGFFIAATTSNYLRLQTLIADANACLISMYNLVKGIQPEKKEVFEQVVDEYMIATLDYELLNYTDKTKNEFNKIMSEANSIEPKDEKGLSLFSELHSRMDDLLTNDQEIALTARRIVTPRHWFIITLLAALLFISLLSFRDGSFFISFFVGIMFITTYHIMILIHEIDSNLFLGKQLSFKDPQQVFEGINRLPYYPEYALKRGYAKPEEKNYRLGVYKNYPKSLEKEIKLVETNKN